MLEKYESLSSKILFITIGAYEPDMVNELQVMRDGKRLVVVTTDGYKWLSRVYCTTPVQALKELRKLITLHLGE